MQIANYAPHDDLAELLQRNLNFTPQNPVTPDQQFLFETTQQQQQQQVYSSQHYTGTAYMRDGYAAEPTNVDNSSWQSTLLQHDINPASLSSSQILLYQNANYEQRLRLLEMWRVAPPRYSDRSNTETHTTLQREEELAKLRYERRLHERTVQPETKQAAEIEPYMASGFDLGSRREDTPHMDTVYAAAAGLWQAPNYGKAVEDQYGAWEQARTFERLQSLHDKVQRERETDEDMVM